MSINLGKKLTGLGIALALTTAGALANTLSSVEINAAQDGYAIVLKTDSQTQMKKVVNSPDKMSIELKNVEAAEDLSTVYNNVANIDNVTIQPLSKEDLKITLQGKDISSSKVYFEEAKTLPAAAESSETIELNGPVAGYSPVYPKAKPVEVDQTANPQVNAALTAVNIDREKVVAAKSVLKKAGNKAQDANILVALGILVIAGALMFRTKKKAPLNAQIGLSQSLKSAQTQREIGLAQKLANPSASANSLGSSVSTGYGMRAYQQSQKNPYMTSNLTPHRTGVSGIPRKPAASRKPVSTSNFQPKAAQKSPVMNSSPLLQNTIASQAPVSSSMAMNHEKAANIDGMKFLESITKIYEKNGRTDLAKGLKDNLRKVRTAKI